ncbi:MAG: hypothetical protein K5770_09835 [Lachnospiraceae bacterium]|nr:hypothetical protein [Lachnospiraceae bacterium]
MKKNILGGTIENRQAPLPPPLPEGMKAAGAGRQAPPPPPLPEGMKATGAGRQAPPPPPLPEGMKAAGAGRQAPPPPLPKRMKAAGTQGGPSKGAGRNTLSLSAVRMAEEREKGANIDQYLPAVHARGGELYEGDGCYARSPLDGLYYYAVITGFDDITAYVSFFDQEEASLPFDKIFTVEEAMKELQCFANYGGRGNYFPAVIDSRPGERVSVHYDEDPSIMEELKVSQLRFAFR